MPSSVSGKTSVKSASLKSVPLPGTTMLRNGNRVHPFTRKEAPYPLSYNRIALDYDIWDNIFWRDMRGGSITLHDFAVPPTTSLDLGCGSGAWILEAARAWPDCSFVGVDLVRIQIDVNLVYPHLAPRIEWVQSNILYGLPFPDNTFDHVRICRIAFGIPEDKWEYVIEEAVRVMKPDGAFEMFEENLSFPCGEEFPLPDSANLRFRPSMDSTRTKPSSPEYARGRSSSSSSNTRDPRDHSLLQQAYEAMLHDRFVNATPLSILPYYLSLHLTNLQLHTPVEFLLPPRSRTRFAATTASRSFSDSTPLSSASPSSINTRYSISRCVTPDLGVGSIRMDMSRAPISNNRFSAIYSEKPLALHFEQRAAHMHLRIACFRILDCKDQIWRQFKKLNPTMGKDQFEELFLDYELDMEDRVAMSNTLHKNLDWKKPIVQPPAQLKYYMSEITKAEMRDGRDDEPKVSRTVRAFIGWKP